MTGFEWFKNKWNEICYGKNTDNDLCYTNGVRIKIWGGDLYIGYFNAYYTPAKPMISLMYESYKRNKFEIFE